MLGTVSCQVTSRARTACEFGQRVCLPDLIRSLGAEPRFISSATQRCPCIFTFARMTPASQGILTSECGASCLVASDSYKRIVATCCGRVFKKVAIAA